MKLTLAVQKKRKKRRSKKKREVGSQRGFVRPGVVEEDESENESSYGIPPIRANQSAADWQIEFGPDEFEDSPQDPFPKTIKCGKIIVAEDKLHNMTVMRELIRKLDR